VSAQIVAVHRPGFNAKDFSALGVAVFDELACDKLGLLNSAALALSTPVSSAAPSAMLVDIGGDSTSIYPQYEKIIMRSAVQLTAVGGESVTAMLEQLSANHFSTQITGTGETLESSDVTKKGGADHDEGQGHGHGHLIPRRRLEIARKAKEKCAYVSQDYSADCRRFGGMKIGGRRVRVMMTQESELDAAGDGSATPGSAAAEAEVAVRELGVTLSLPLPAIGSSSSSPSSTCVSLTLSAERFHCAEVLFQPALLESCANTQVQAQAQAQAHARGNKDISNPSAQPPAIMSLPEAVLAAAAAVDESVRCEVCGTIVLSGGTARLPGLAARLSTELAPGLKRLGVADFKVVVAEEVSRDDKDVGKDKSKDKSESIGEWESSAVWVGAMDVFSRCAAMGAGGRAEPLSFVSAVDFEASGGSAFEIAACSY